MSLLPPGAQTAYLKKQKAHFWFIKVKPNNVAHSLLFLFRADPSSIFGSSVQSIVKISTLRRDRCVVTAHRQHQTNNVALNVQ